MRQVAYSKGELFMADDMEKKQGSQTGQQTGQQSGQGQHGNQPNQQVQTEQPAQKKGTGQHQDDKENLDKQRRAS
jgi:hypothetical protein